MRIGHGYDVHAFCEGRPLIIGGVSIPYHKGLAGHSDADVLLHAICDALLGAAALGDIGKHFPDNAAEFKNIDSRLLLQDVVQKLSDLGYQINNIDSTVIAQQPKLAAFIQTMRQHIAEDCRIEINQVNVKATTTEKLGFAGREEGIAAHAVCLLQQS
ncbi:MAG: 2-C-methyl-D-erythritol 2,4-cyclodiphosphate synthase [Gammaproteobacteria bacterium]|nr:2-C-methyl-D-erythritol 2,4-cyclodiphosphate synthase [Gammaproteobacteria bacterium]MDH5728547.1 2-C-methyl-D-erythritol 2,4-cyclodiphosphate synthase [Gammaproteobacteria bacterium]